MQIFYFAPQMIHVSLNIKNNGLKRDFSNFSVYKSPGEIINMRVPIE